MRHYLAPGQTLVVTCGAGVGLQTACEDAREIARYYNRYVILSYKDTNIPVEPNSTIDELREGYFTQIDYSRESFLNKYSHLPEYPV